MTTPTDQVSGRETPLTDAEAEKLKSGFLDGRYVPVNFARTLEQKLTEAEGIIGDCQRWFESIRLIMIRDADQNSQAFWIAVDGRDKTAAYTAKKGEA